MCGPATGGVDNDICMSANLDTIVQASKELHGACSLEATAISGNSLVSECLHIPFPKTVILQLILRKLVSADSSGKSLIYSFLLTFNIYESNCTDSYSMFILCRQECFKTQSSIVGLYHSLASEENTGSFIFCGQCFLQRFSRSQAHGLAMITGKSQLSLSDFPWSLTKGRK